MVTSGSYRVKQVKDHHNLIAAFVTYSVVMQIIYFRSFIVFLQALEVALFCILLIAQWRYDLENVVVFLLLVALLGKFNL